MKSIKEKSEEYSFIDEVIDSDGKVLYTNYSLPKRNAFEQGANYVLDAIQSCIDRHEDGCLALEVIILTIDELKRNNYGIPQ